MPRKLFESVEKPLIFRVNTHDFEYLYGKNQKTIEREDKHNKRMESIQLKFTLHSKGSSSTISFAYICRYAIWQNGNTSCLFEQKPKENT